MTVSYEERLSDSPFIDLIWRTHADSTGKDIVSADTSWDMIITHQNGETRLTVWGAMTRANTITHTEGSEGIGIRFKLGTFMPYLHAYSLLNSGTVLPEATDNHFWLAGSVWEYPSYENAEIFINGLLSDGLLAHDQTVEATLLGDPQYMSLRSVQRRFLRITGLNQRYIHAIERARQAAALLRSGMSILDAVYETGYADQQSMTKSLSRLLGQTPAQIAGYRVSE